MATRRSRVRIALDNRGCASIFVFVRTASPREWALALLSAFIRDNRPLSRLSAIRRWLMRGTLFGTTKPNLRMPVRGERLDRTQEVRGSNQHPDLLPIRPQRIGIAAPRAGAEEGNRISRGLSVPEIRPPTASQTDGFGGARRSGRRPTQRSEPIRSTGLDKAVGRSGAGPRVGPDPAPCCPLAYPSVP